MHNLGAWHHAFLSVGRHILRAKCKKAPLSTLVQVDGWCDECRGYMSRAPITKALASRPPIYILPLAISSLGHFYFPIGTGEELQAHTTSLGTVWLVRTTSLSALLRTKVSPSYSGPRLAIHLPHLWLRGAATPSQCTMSTAWKITHTPTQVMVSTPNSFDTRREKASLSFSQHADPTPIEIEDAQWGRCCAECGKHYWHG